MLWNGGGCTETMIHGCSNVGSLDAGIHLPLVLERHAARRALPDAPTFDALLAQFKADVTRRRRRRSRTGSAACSRPRRSLRPQPMRSLLIDDCIERGIEFNAGGARYNWSVINVAGPVQRGRLAGRRARGRLRATGRSAARSCWRPLQQTLRAARGSASGWSAARATATTSPRSTTSRSRSPSTSLARFGRTRPGAEGAFCPPASCSPPMPAREKGGRHARRPPRRRAAGRLDRPRRRARPARARRRCCAA